LAVARGLTEAMGGTVTAEDTPGGGLTMVVSLRSVALPSPATAVPAP
jgi:two-component system sensor histidine kinase KdpD